MARIAGIEMPDNWKVDFALTRLKGIGWYLAENILKKTEISNTKRVSDLTADDLSKIATELDTVLIEGDLVRKVRSDIQRLRDITSYRGIRHTRGLPVNGQRTRTNARTKRGKRKTVGAYKKEMLAKMTAAKQGGTK